MFSPFKTKIDKRKLIFVGVIFAFAFLFFSVYATSSSKFTLDNVVLCRNLDKESMPIDIIEEETQPTDRIILVFDYSHANIGQTLNVAWFYNDKLVTDDSLKLNQAEGQRRLALLSNSGGMLPKGAYRVKVSIGDKILQQISFVIS